MEKSADAEENGKQIFHHGGIIRFGDRLKNAIGDMSYRAFAGRCDMSEKVIRNYVAGKTYPSLDRISVLADALGVDVEWLAFGEEKYSEGNKNTEAVKSAGETTRDWLRVFERLSDEDKTKVTDFIAMNGIRCLLLMCDAGSLDLLTLEPFKREVALLFKQMTVDEVREILREIRRIEAARSQGHYGGGSLSSGVA
ncbi:helix-turn-helix domain-containing protein [Salmonella enterica]|nr:helix-turn-helix domain-containing protein [Salmonella enterica subsp. diarizonae serovar 48:i:z]EJQ7406468.1 helix-turn-helix domain-containing protein [Salmonella enterica]EJQ8217057.1 helix-turn-helix domain-containing protein [Salmonella enterica]EJX3079340.1 helix-turn-helix domain-containing protein [Salmonella enterica]EJX3102699.1 helix-turn-helix domain-containing protein [Salmonella enterica]